jgi:hypothetical protein
MVGSVGAGTSGRVSSNFITEEDAQGTSSEGVIIGDTKVEIDSGRLSSNFITKEDAQGTSSEGVIIGDTKVEIDGGSERGNEGGGSWRWMSSHSSSE